MASKDECERAYEKGYITGANAGYGKGNRDGYKEGYEKGLSEGYKKGSDAGYKKGYEAAREQILSGPKNLVACAGVRFLKLNRKSRIELVPKQ